MQVAFSQIEHRPWPLPDRPWILQQRWLDLLFLHWEVDADAVRSDLPGGLELDTFEGKAWLGIVPFRMEGVAPRGFPKPSAVSDFPEINIRAYVKRDGKPGVWFYSLDVPHRLPVWLARTFFHLPYFYGSVVVREDNESVHYVSDVQGRHFDAVYRGLEAVEIADGSFEQWATERYCFYSSSPSGQLHRCEVQHPRWSLQRAICNIKANTMLDAFSIGKMHPSILFSKWLPVVAWWPEQL